MSARNILLICGTMNQTRAMLAIGRHLSGHRCYYTPFYADGLLRWAAERGLLNFTVLGGPLRTRTLAQLQEAGVHIDDRGESREYEMVITCTDLLIQRNIKAKRIILVQEGLTEPEGWLYLGVKYLGLPRFLANTAAFGMSQAYEAFCVASPGYRDLFAAKGAPTDRMVVTGIPNFDHVDAYAPADLPYRDYVLVCTSNARETFKWDNRTRFLKRARRIANGRQVLVKLHPAERHARALREIRHIIPDAIVVQNGAAESLIPNCVAVVTQYSTVAFTAAALGKEVHSYIPPDLLRRVLPLQNEGTSAERIARVCQECLDGGPRSISTVRKQVELQPIRHLPLDNVRLMPR